MYCGNIQVLDPGQPLPQNNLILNIVDLKGNMIKIHRDAATTVQQLRIELGGNVRLFIGGQVQADDTIIANVINQETLRVLVDGRPRRNDIITMLDSAQPFERVLIPVNYVIGEDLRRDRTATEYQGLRTNEARQRNFVYILYRKILDQREKGVVVNHYVRFDLGQDGKYHRPTQDCQFAIKEISKQEMREDAYSEIGIMEILRNGEVEHPNLIRMIEFGQDTETLYIIMPYKNRGDLFNKLIENGRMTEANARFCVRKMVAGSYFFQQSGFSMNDTSMENTMMHSEDDTEEPVLIDFGAAEYLAADDRGRRLKNIANKSYKPYAIAPEVYLGNIYQERTHDTTLADIWSIGIIAICLVTGIQPVNYRYRYPQVDRKDYYFKYIRHGDVRGMLESWSQQRLAPQLSRYFHDFVNRILLETAPRSNPYQRLPLPLMLEHPWITGEIISDAKWLKYRTMINLFQKLLYYSHRITADNFVMQIVTVDEQQAVVSDVNDFRIAFREYADANGDVDNLIEYCNTHLQLFFHDEFQL